MTGCWKTFLREIRDSRGGHTVAGMAIFVDDADNTEKTGFQKNIINSPIYQDNGIVLAQQKWVFFSLGKKYLLFP